jgi:Spy/CpxP family protein refolding chaperone
MDKPWKVILAFTGIFLAGVLVGGLVTLRVVRNVTHRLPMSDQFGPQLMRRLATQLELSPEQEEKLRPIVGRAAEELRQLRHTTQRTTESVILRMQGEISALLTPAQKAKLDTLVDQQRERLKRFREERARRFKDEPPPR